MKIQSKAKKALFKSTEFLVITFATWLNPQAWLAISALKFCFSLLELLQEDNLSQSEGDRPTSKHHPLTSKHHR